MSDESAPDLRAFMDSGGYDNRTEAFRDLARLGLRYARLDSSQAGECFATLSYVFNHHTRELSKRLTDAHHDRHHLHGSTIHGHLDHANCLDVAGVRREAALCGEIAK